MPYMGNSAVFRPYELIGHRQENESVDKPGFMGEEENYPGIFKEYSKNIREDNGMFSGLKLTDRF
jgi:hypothetical protein